ncbi:hypothetical protein BJV82DRAFT_667827 [Fennellomyces sp. T-0311]|nr:hypothetical protein BJV82DRAFT_667827 [Fennellomyces sp. T-0311]
MLNPNASEFRPGQFSASPPTELQEKTQQQKKRSSKPKQSKHHGKADRRPSTDHQGKKSSGKTKSQPQQTGRRHKAATTQPSSAQPENSFGLLTKFITIEEAIDPVFRTRPVEDGSKGKGSGEGSTDKLVHGYERYIEWIGRCLGAFETVTVVGMDYAIADVVSLVTILQDRGIGEHEEVETFTLDQGNKRYTSGIQVKLHLCT